MKRKLVVFMLAGMMAAATIMSGCGNKSTDETSAAAETSVAAESADTVISTEELLSGTDYDVTECVTLNDYENMSVELSSSYEVTDADVQSYVESIIAYYPNYTETDKTTVEEGDIVNIDYVGTLDGEEFDGGSAEGYNLEIGSDSFIDGFEDGLIGAEVGSTVELNLTFPEDYSSTDLAGQAVVFTVTVNAIMEESEMTYDELTDEYVASNFASSGISTVDDFLAEVKSGLESNNESEKEDEIQELVFEKMKDECTVNIPDGLLDEKIADYKSRVSMAAEAYGVEYADYLETYMGVTEEEFEEEVPDYIEENLIEEMILEAIVADRGLTITQSDFDDFVSMYVSYYGFTDDEEFYDTYGGEAYVKLSYAENVALTDLLSSVTTTVAASADTAETAE